MAAYLGIAPSTIRAYVARGQMPSADRHIGREPDPPARPGAGKPAGADAVLVAEGTVKSRCARTRSCTPREMLARTVGLDPAAPRAELMRALRQYRACLYALVVSQYPPA